MHKSIVAVAIALLAMVAAAHSVELGYGYDGFGGNTVLVEVPQTYQVIQRPVYLRQRVVPEIGASLGGVIQTPLADLGGGIRAGISPAGAGFEASIGLGAPGGGYLGRGRIIG